MRERETELLTDARLSREARIMGLYLAGYADEVEVSTEEWQRVLGRSPRGGTPKRQTIAGYASELELFGWIERRAGGAGSPRYRFLQSPRSTTEEEPATVPQGDRRALQSPKRTGEAGSYSPPGGPQRGPVVVGVDARESPPVSPSLSTAGAAALESRRSILNGVAAELAAYVAERVPAARQSGYIATVANWRSGVDRSVFQVPGGGQLPAEDQGRILRAALDELRGTDERKMKADPGDPRNLRTKVRVLVGKETDPPPRPRGPGPRRPTTSSAPSIAGDRGAGFQIEE